MRSTLLAPLALLCAVSLVLLAACSQPKDRFRLEGSIEGVGQADIYVYADDGYFDGIDTIHIVDGQFTYERTLTQSMVLTILYPNFSQSYIVAEPGAVVEMQGNASKLGEASITGSKENELLTDFRQQVAHKTPADARLAAADFIRQNKSSVAAIAVFKKYYATAESPEPSSTLSLLKTLQQAQPRSAAVASIARRLTPLLATTARQPLPDFTAVDTDGRTVSKASLAGRPTVIAVTASWSPQCNTLYPVLRRLHKLYGARLNLVILSLDLDRRAQLRRLETDSLSLPVICDGRAFDTPAATALGLSQVPGNLLVNAEGQVVARNVETDDLEARVAQMRP